MVTMDGYLLEYLQNDLDTVDELYRTVFTASLSVFRARETLNDITPIKSAN